MAVIVSSEIYFIDTIQHDGRRYVTERHVDVEGGVHDAVYLAAADADLTANMAATAAGLEQSLPGTEIAANVASISTVYPPGVTSSFASLDDTNAAARDAYAGATAVAATLLGAYLAGLADAQIAALFGPDVDTAALRTTLNSQLALRNTGLVQKGQ